MPGGFASLDTSFPNLEGQTTEQKLRALTDYLYQLLEHLRYTLRNLGEENFNPTDLQHIMEPIHAEIEDEVAGLSTRIDADEAGIQTLVTKTGINSLGQDETLYSEITQNADAITAEVTRATGAEGTLGSRITQNADAITAEVTRATGAEATLTLTAQGLRTDVNAASGAASSAQQTADGIKAQVTDGQGNYTVLNLKSDGLHIGNASGTSTIDGGSITANSITLSRLGSDVTGSFGDDNPAYIKNTYIDFRQVQSPAVYAGDFYGAAYHDYDANGNSYLTFDIVPDGNRGGGIILSSDVANIVLFSVENVVQGSQGSWVLLSRINGAGDATCIETTYDQSTGKIGKYLVGRWTISDGLVLGPYSAHAGLYGSLAERNSISNPETGQIFFVI